MPLPPMDNWRPYGLATPLNLRRRVISSFEEKVRWKYNLNNKSKAILSFLIKNVQDTTSILLVRGYWCALTLVEGLN